MKFLFAVGWLFWLWRVRPLVGFLVHVFFLTSVPRASILDRDTPQVWLLIITHIEPGLDFNPNSNIQGI